MEKVSRRRAWITGAILGAGLGLSVSAAAQAAAPAADRGPGLWQQAAAAMGAAPYSLDIRAHLLTRPLGSTREQQGRLEIKLLLPEMYQRSMTTRMPFGSFGMVQTLNGSQFWTHRVLPVGGPGFFMRRGEGNRQPSAAERKQFQARMLASLQAQFARAQIVWMLHLPAGFAAQYGGVAQAADGSKAEWLKLNGANASPDAAALLFLDPKTMRPLMLQYQGVVPQAPRNFRGFGGRGPRGGPAGTPPPPGARRRFFMRMMKPQTIRLHFSGWRKVQGRWFPMRLVKTTLQGVTFEQLDVKKIQINSKKLTAAQFAKR